jgi:hypothetical protein
VRDPEGAAAMGMIPVQFDSESFYGPEDRRLRENGNKKVIASHVQSVCNRYESCIDNS